MSSGIWRPSFLGLYVLKKTNYEPAHQLMYARGQTDCTTCWEQTYGDM